MKMLILLCLAALALADDVERPYGSGYRDIDDGHRSGPWRSPSYKPKSPVWFPSHKPDDYYRPGRVHYHYNIDYPKYGARQGKQETIDYRGTRGSYFVDEPLSDTYVSYDYPRH